MTDKELEYQNLKKEFDNQAFRNKLKEHYPHRCSNCGSEENIEYHHVVPLKLGGTNAITNIIPLCHKCHKAAHCGQHMSHYVDSAGGGRKSMAKIEEHSDVFDAYINGEIGNRKCKELLGYSPRSEIINRPEFKRYIASKGIARVKNIVDLAGTTRESGLVDGAIVGEVQYLDGRLGHITYKDTGKNNIQYKKRNNAKVPEPTEPTEPETEKIEESVAGIAPIAEESLRDNFVRNGMRKTRPFRDLAKSSESPSRQIERNMRWERKIAEKRVQEYAESKGISNIKELCDVFSSTKYVKIVNKVMRGTPPEEALSEILLAG